MEILGDRKFVEVPGSRTHDLPPLLVRMAPDVKRLDKVMGMANQLGTTSKGSGTNAAFGLSQALPSIAMLVSLVAGSLVVGRVFTR